MGDNCPGLFGENYCLVARDENSGFITCSPDKNKDTCSVAEGLRHHFSQSLDQARAKGFMVYSDSAADLKRYVRNLG